ncbi:DUF6928 family protein [Micromonospora matsumotoense]|uniref:DUF6928 family protein n=1 Tax=Micromonospora matsumotoense TaxID=121616 RepID=UPI003407266B
MGANTALFAFTTGELRPALRARIQSDSAGVRNLVRELHPGYQVTPIGGGSLGDHSYPPVDTTYATTLGDAELFCGRRLVCDPPSQLPAGLLRAAAGRRIIMHAMHSTSDWLCFAVWEHGGLVRSLSLSSEGGIRENIGEPYDFELPFWAGEHPVEPMFSDDPYPLAFHPLHLGEQALRALFGFTLEGRRDPDDIDPLDVHLHGFRVTDPTGREQSEREGLMEQILQSRQPPRRYRMMSDGTLCEFDDNEI